MRSARERKEGALEAKAHSLLVSASWNPEELAAWLAASYAREEEKNQLYDTAERAAVQWMERCERAESILRRAQAPKRPDGTYNYSREAFEQMANEYFDRD